MKKVGNSWFKKASLSLDKTTRMECEIQVWRNRYTKKWCAIIWVQGEQKTYAAAEAYDRFETRGGAFDWADLVIAKTNDRANQTEVK